jgi:hypothetical protein
MMPAAGRNPNLPAVLPEIPDDLIDRAGEQVMNGHGFRSLRRHLLEQIPEPETQDGFLEQSLQWLGEQLSAGARAIGDFFEWLFMSDSSVPAGGGGTSTPPASWNGETGGGGASIDFASLMTTAAIAVIVLLLMVIAAMIVKSVERRRPRVGLVTEAGLLSDVTTPPGDQAVSTFESRAVQLAAEGQHRAAVRELLLGSMSWVERAGMIRYRQGLTNRDYVRALWRRPDKSAAFAATALQFEYLYFGRRAATPAMFEECLRNFREAFRVEETPAVSV